MVISKTINRPHGKGKKIFHDKLHNGAINIMFGEKVKQ